jgi:hypothetical protein
MSQWKEVESDKSTGFLDKNGVEILMGDKVSYRRKVKAEHRWERGTCRVTVIPGHYEMVTANVVGFGRIVKKHYYDQSVIQIEYLQLKEPHGIDVFRVYRTENLSVVFKSNEK